MRHAMTRILTLILLTFFVSGCGIKGGLATPAPLFSKGEPVDNAKVETDDDSLEDEEEPFYGPEFEDPLTGARD